MELILCVFIPAIILLIILLAAKIVINEKQLKDFKDQLHEIRTENQNRLISVDTFGSCYTELAKELQQYVEDEKRLIKKAEEDRQSVNMMVAGISHDFRTPLTSATGYLEMAEESGELSEKNSEYINTALRKMRYLKELSDEFFTLSLIENTDRDEIHSLSFKKYLENVTLDQHEWIEGRGLQFSADITDDKCEIRAAEVDILRLLENLYSNTRKYAKSIIHVELKRQEKIVFRISNDTDIIKCEEIENIFKPFHRASSGEVQGSGLGLYVAKRIVMKYGGDIRASMEGDRFIIEVEM